MPQMAPISWLVLFFLFTLSFFLFNIMNYFNKLFLKINNENIESSSSNDLIMTDSNNSKNNMNWKW